MRWWWVEDEEHIHDIPRDHARSVQKGQRERVRLVHARSVVRGRALEMRAVLNKVSGLWIQELWA